MAHVLFSKKSYVYAFGELKAIYFAIHHKEYACVFVLNLETLLSDVSCCNLFFK
jgi:hypothetical protein